MKTTAALLSALTLVALIASSAPAHPRVNAPLTDPAAPGYSWPAVDMDRDGVFDRVDRCPCTRPGVEVDHWGCDMKSSAPPGRTRGQGEIEDELLSGGTITLDDVFFRTDSARLRKHARTMLRDVAAVIRRNPRLKFEVGGHADRRGTEKYNRELSRKRAEEVRRFLTQDAKVRTMQLAVRPYGETRPVTPERNARELQANRRVEFRLLNPEALPRGARIAQAPSLLAYLSR